MWLAKTIWLIWLARNHVVGMDCNRRDSSYWFLILLTFCITGQCWQWFLCCHYISSKTVFNAAYVNYINLWKLSVSSIPNNLATCHDCSFLLWDFQACPWECHSYGNPTGNFPWDGMGQHTFVFPMRLRNRMRVSECYWIVILRLYVWILKSINFVVLHVSLYM